jgi:dipeptidyl aminopeptidase/acylaminoacyl peptidase
MPEKWNEPLVMYCHGYSPGPASLNDSKPNAMLNVFLNEGFAVAQSGYAAGGWAIQEAMNGTEALRRYFVKKYGAAKETCVTGHSMGGFPNMALMESLFYAMSPGLNALVEKLLERKPGQAWCFSPAS